MQSIVVNMADNQTKQIDSNSFKTKTGKDSMFSFSQPFEKWLKK